MAGALSHMLGSTGLSPPARYWRLRFPNGSTSDDYVVIQEIELRSTVGGARQDTSTAAASSTDDAIQYPAPKAFDNNISTDWSSALNSTIDSWISNDLGSSKDIAQIAITAHGTTPGWLPTDIVMEFSANNTAWTVDTRWTNLTGLAWVKSEQKLVTRGGEHRRIAGLTAVTTDNGGWTNFTLRNMIPGTIAPTGGTKCRITIPAGATEGLTISKCYIGIKGAGAYEFASAPTQVKFNGGNNNFAIAAGATQVSDDITLTTSPGDSLVVSMFCPTLSTAADTFKRVAMTGVTGGFKSGDDAATQTPSGYTANNFLYLSDLQIWTP